MSIRDVLRNSRPKVVPVEISSGTVYVRGMSGAARAAYMEMAKDKAPTSFKVAALALCEENGVLVFDPNNPHHLEELREMDSEDLEKINIGFFDASGLRKEAEKAAEKKSEASPSASGGTGSQESSAAQ